MNLYFSRLGRRRPIKDLRWENPVGSLDYDPGAGGNGAPGHSSEGRLPLGGPFLITWIAASPVLQAFDRIRVATENQANSVAE